MRFQSFKYITLSLLSTLFLVACTTDIKENRHIDNPEQEISTSPIIKSKVSKLLSTMTIDDKVGEMTQLSLDMLLVGNPYNVKDPYEFDSTKLQNVLVDLKVGSILNNGGHARPRDEWHDIITVIQDYATNKKSTGIPVLYGIDAIHGANYTQNSTLYPQQINLAATWNTELVKELSAISAYETKASAIPWAFAPVLDVGRDPRWSRFWETFGEDVHLVSEMGKATFQGLQGENISAPTKVAACMKHFLGYSISRSGKDRTPSYIPERQLKEYIIPPFEVAIKQGAKTVMINSGEINGIPVHANPKILNDLLRDELGFNGFTVTDWEDIKYLYERHHVAKDYKDAIRISVNAGIDMSMVPIDLEYTRLLKELVNEGEVSMSRIDEAVSRILTVKYELGLFETPIEDKQQFTKCGSTNFSNKSLQAALESIVLLKNENATLPLDKKLNILVTGPTANSQAAINGAWTGTWQGKDPKYDTPGKLTIYQALQTNFGKEQVKHIKGTGIDVDINTDKAVKAARSSDVAVICIGEMPYVEIPGNINDLNLPNAQIELVKAIARTKTPIVLLFVGGRPRIIREVETLVDAVLFVGLPGDEGGKAVAQIISGEYNPDGRLPFTYPRFANDLILYDHKGTEKKKYDFSDNGFDPQWQFGEGLSYTSYDYSDMKVSELVNDEWTITVDVRNGGSKKGNEVVKLFSSDKVASITPSNKRLRGFQKISLQPGETKTMKFKLKPKDLAFVGLKNEWVVEPGDFELSIDNLKQLITFQ